MMETLLPNAFLNAPQKRHVTLQWDSMKRTDLVAQHLKC